MFVKGGLEWNKTLTHTAILISIYIFANTTTMFKIKVLSAKKYASNGYALISFIHNLGFQESLGFKLNFMNCEWFSMEILIQKRLNGLIADRG